jgi:hypothetical protein
VIQRRNPNTIYLGGGAPGGEGGITYVNDIPAGVEIIPGMLIETYKDGDAVKWRPCSSATNVLTPAIAVENLMMNKGVDDPYAIQDLVLAGILRHGSMWWGLLPSGQDIANQDLLQSNGDGRLKEATSAAAGDGVARFKSHDNIGAITADTRCRVEVLF